MIVEFFIAFLMTQNLRFTKEKIKYYKQYENEYSNNKSNHLTKCPKL